MAMPIAQPPVAPPVAQPLVAQPLGAQPSLAARIAPHLPFLRRYARALCGAQAAGDAQVARLLEALIAAPGLFETEDAAQGVDDRVALYRAYQRFAAIGAAPGDAAGEALSARERTAQERLSHLTPRARQALLLSAVEGFSRAQVALVLDIDEGEAGALIDAANADLRRQISARVLIIEDEPMIAMDIAAIVTDLGHAVVASTETQAKAVAAAIAHRPDLVLADIRLLGGGSGIEAVREILAAFAVPVIFITAFPERLFSGERPEPTFLITKPFKTAAVQAAVSQALFFRSSADMT